MSAIFEFGEIDCQHAVSKGYLLILARATSDFDFSSFLERNSNMTHS